MLNILPKRLTEKEKHQIIQKLLIGEKIELLSKEFGVTKVTINRNLKKLLGNTEFEKLSQKIKCKNKLNVIKGSKSSIKLKKYESKEFNKSKDKELDNCANFTELTPLLLDIDNESRRDLTSIDIKSFNFPKIVYIVVNKKIELETKLLKDYPEWKFLSDNDLNRRTLEIFFDIKLAKRACNREQKVIKVPNPEVLKLVVPILLERGITRIIGEDKLIAL